MDTNTQGMNSIPKARLGTRARSVRFLCLFLLTLTLMACPSNGQRTFAGFTFGGGGKTYDTEPAKLLLDKGESSLTAGTPESPVYLELHWAGPDTGKQLELTSAQISVKDAGGSTDLKQGHIVIQALNASIAHGSFDLQTKAADGREFKVVGSFTASLQNQNPSGE